MIVAGQVDISGKAVASVTTVSGMASAPVAVIFFARVNANSALTGGSVGSEPVNSCFGVLTASGQFAVSSGRDASGADVDRRHATGIVHDHSANANGGVFVGALTSDGFTLTCTDATVAGNFLYYIAIGGPGVTAQVGTITAPGSTGVTDHNLGIKPHMLLHWTLGGLSESSDATHHIGLGAVAYDLTQGSLTVSSGTTSVEYCTDQEGFAYNPINSATLRSRGVATAWLSNGVRVDWSAVNPGDLFHYVAIRGITSQLVGTVTTNSLGGVSTESGMPFEPDAGFVFSTMRNSSAFHTPGTPTGTTTTGRLCRMSVGAWVGDSTQFGFGSCVYNADAHDFHYGTGITAGFQLQNPGLQSVSFDTTAVNSDGFDITTETIVGALGAQRPLATLAFLDRAPRENIYPPPHIGAP